ncbi:MAG: glycosyltransferase family 4 protein [Acidobacteria bacterium]|nr:glycosyltransferase family 4 protein [Acidobacteriota bacterium]
MSGPRPMRVLFVESQTELGGAQVALLTMLESLDRTRAAPVYASLGFGQGDLPDRVEALGIRVYRMPGGRFRNLASTAARISALRKLIHKEAIDVVLSNSGHPLLYARPAAFWAGRPCVWWVHGPVHEDPLRGELISVVQKLLGADALFANSEYTAGILRQLFAGHPAVRVVRHGIDLERHAPAPAQGMAARAALGILPGERVAGIFGRLQPWKGQHVFLQAAAVPKLRETKRELAARFLVVGGSVFGLDRGYAEELRRQAADAGIAERVLFLGQRSDTNALMNACDVVVHASVEPEPWGLVLAEAMAAGRAVIGAAAGGPLEMIADGRTGMLTPPGDAAALADAMESLFRHPERRRALGEAARKHAEQHFERRRAAAVLCAELQRACDAHAARG